MTRLNSEAVRRDFDEIAQLGDRHDGGSNRYDGFLLSLVPARAARVLDVGCGTGRLTAKLATVGREVVGIDLSAEMIARANARASQVPGLSFICGDFLTSELGSRRFDCLITSAALHHMPADLAIARMKNLLRPGGRLVIHDVRTDVGPLDKLGALVLLAHDATIRLLRTGWPLRHRRARAAWARHGQGERYLNVDEAKELGRRLLPGSRVYKHWFWRYTIVWDEWRQPV
jgi:SAM-dependent methyltransferase